MRLDLSQQGTVLPASIVELERQLAEAFRVTFAARQAAYDDQVLGRLYILQSITLHTKGASC